MTVEEMRDKLIEFKCDKDVIDGAERWVSLGLTLDQVLQMQQKRYDSITKLFKSINKMCKPGEKVTIIYP